MTFASFELTLTRWHHVADRIKAIGEGKHREALATLGGTTLAHAVEESQIKALKSRGERALGLIQEAREAFVCVGAIRMALAQANADKGITVLLAEAEAKRRESRLLADYAGIDLLTRVPVASVNQALASQPAKTPDVYGRGGPGGVAVALVEATALDFVAGERTKLDAQVAAINDKVAELNRATLALDLPAKLAKDAGL